MNFVFTRMTGRLTYVSVGLDNSFHYKVYTPAWSLLGALGMKNFIMTKCSLWELK